MLKKYIGIGCFLLLALFVPDVSLAAIGDTDAVRDMLEATGAILSELLKVFTILAILFLEFFGYLLGPEYLTGETAQEAIRPMWVIVRNMTNIGFVLIIIVLAFTNLFSSFGADNGWTIKEKLPRIIIALVAINFSLAAFKVVIDTIHVGTQVVFSLADATADEKYKNSLKTLLAEDVAGCEASGSGKCISILESINKVMCKSEFLKNPSAETAKDNCAIYFDPSGDFATEDTVGRNLMFAFGVQFAHLEKLPLLFARPDMLVELLSATLFSMIMSMAFLLVLGALFFVLVFRLVALWVMMVFSPFILASKIVGFSAGSGDTAEKAVAYLLVPIRIAAVFAVTFVMMHAMTDLGVERDSSGASSLVIVGTQFGGSWMGILWQIGVIAIFWDAAFKALSGTHADKIVQGFQGIGEAGAKLAGRAIGDVPIAPMGGVKLGAITQIDDVMRTAATSMRGNQFDSINKHLNGNDPNREGTEALYTDIDRANRQSRTATAAFNKAAEILKDHGIRAVSTNARARSEFKDLLLKATGNDEAAADRVLTAMKSGGRATQTELTKLRRDTGILENNATTRHIKSIETDPSSSSSSGSESVTARTINQNITHGGKTISITVDSSDAFVSKLNGLGVNPTKNEALTFLNAVFGGNGDEFVTKKGSNDVSDIMDKIIGANIELSDSEKAKLKKALEAMEEAPAIKIK